MSKQTVKDYIDSKIFNGRGEGTIQPDEHNSALKQVIDLIPDVSVIDIKRVAGSNDLKVTKSDGSSSLVDIAPLVIYKPLTAQALDQIIQSRPLGYASDLTDIDVSEITNFSYLFYGQQVGDVSNWNVSNGVDFTETFKNAQFTGTPDFTQWNVQLTAIKTEMFKGSPLEGNEPSWY